MIGRREFFSAYSCIVIMLIMLVAHWGLAVDGAGGIRSGYRKVVQVRFLFGAHKMRAENEERRALVILRSHFPSRLPCFPIMHVT